uniref:Subtilisin-like protease n=1 Tax=Cajanus cajan TaxID=3821 RepID=A0A151UAB7_CAJCA|nr:Subtilisin-like protease [Cajanus cajan]
MGFSFLHLISFLLLCSFLQQSSHAIKRSYIVYLGSHSHGPNPSASDLESATNSHYKLLASHLRSKHINGFAAVLEEEEALELAKNPNVVSVFQNKGHKLQTTRSWEFLGLGSDGVVSKDSIWEKARYGEGVIIGNIDTGVWPESKSFSDEGMGPVPSRWKGICQLDNFTCNRKKVCGKLIGARFFSNGYESKFGKLDTSLYTARDILNHGTSTLSIAGEGLERLFTKKKTIPIYHYVLLGTKCNIISKVSVYCASTNTKNPWCHISYSSRFWSCIASTSKFSFFIYLFTYFNLDCQGASLSSGLPFEKFYSLISSIDAKAANATIEEAQLCRVGTLDPEKAKGKILVCLLKELDGLSYAEEEALSTGTVGLILANNKQRGNDIVPFPHLMPTSHINYTDGQHVYSYVEHTKSPMAYMTRAKTLLGIKPAPVIASFSSRGPNPIQPTILKPDITAPGVDILSAGSEAFSPTGFSSDTRRVPYNIGSGTSESCPHVSGIIGLLKRLYPNWSPAALKSAIMTTAMTLVNNNKRPILDQSREEATPFAYGAGHIQPELAMDPGLVYDLNTSDYLNFLGYNLTQIKMFSRDPHICPKSYNIYDLNYPSITVPGPGKHSTEVTHTVTNVGSPGTYEVHVKAPSGVSVLVEPRSLTFSELGEKKRFKVILKGIEVSKHASGYVFGELLWSDGKHKVKSPLVVQHNQK